MVGATMEATMEATTMEAQASFLADSTGLDGLITPTIIPTVTHTIILLMLIPIRILTHTRTRKVSLR